ncbi:MAG TPA: response regulator [Treponema sp.]|nr:response regulator [Treponema sp.]
MSDLISEAKTKVLIAEDEAIVALDLQGMVTRLGYDVVASVDNGTAAVAAAKRFVPDIILLDIAIAGELDGIEVARKIHEFSSVPIVFCISTPDLSSLMRTKQISYAGYLLKPINPDSLSTTLDTVLYKYNLEKRAELAEERYRKLEKTCSLLKFFTEHDAAYEWVFTTTDGVTIHEMLPENPITKNIISHIESLLKKEKNWFTDVITETVSHQSYCVCAVRDEVSCSVSGMLIPLTKEKQ